MKEFAFWKHKRWTQRPNAAVPEVGKDAASSHTLQRHIHTHSLWEAGLTHSNKKETLIGKDANNQPGDSEKGRLRNSAMSDLMLATEACEHHRSNAAASGHLRKPSAPPSHAHHPPSRQTWLPWPRGNVASPFRDEPGRQEGAGPGATASPTHCCSSHRYDGHGSFSPP